MRIASRLSPAHLAEQLDNPQAFAPRRNLDLALSEPRSPGSFRLAEKISPRHKDFFEQECSCGRQIAKIRMLGSFGRSRESIVYFYILF